MNSRFVGSVTAALRQVVLRSRTLTAMLLAGIFTLTFGLFYLNAESLALMDGNHYSVATKINSTVYVSAFFMVPLAAFFGARSRRTGWHTVEAISPKSRLTVMLHEFASLILPVSLCYVVAALGLTAWAAIGATNTTPYWGYLLLGLLGLITVLSVGYVAGRVCGSWVGPAVALIIVVAGSVLAMDENQVFFNLLPLFPYDGGGPETQYTGLHTAVLVLFATATPVALLLAAHVAQCRALPTNRALAGAAIGCVVVSTIAGVAALADPKPALAENTTTTPHCTGEAPQVCVWPDQIKLAEQAQPALAQANHILAPLGAPIPTVVTPGVVIPGDGLEMNLAIGIDADRVVATAGQNAFALDACDGVPWPEREEQRVRIGYVELKATGDLSFTAEMYPNLAERIREAAATKDDQWLADGLRLAEHCGEGAGG